jgi:GDPmannose 4,6-dehydratase
MTKHALITGISGQDGAYLAQYLINLGYKVTGTSRDVNLNNFSRLRKLCIMPDINLVSMNLEDFKSVAGIFGMSQFDEIYHLAMQSSVGLSFDQPFETINSGIVATLNLLDAIKNIQPDVKLYHASSSECFGETAKAVNAKSPLVPASPYGVSKAAASQLVRIYRESYSIFAINGYMFNHESPLRGKRFVTSKIINAAFNASKGHRESLSLGDVNIIRDWGWAPEYVEAMHKMLQLDNPSDFTIGTGQSYSLLDFVRCTYDHFGLDYSTYLKIDKNLYRPNEIGCNYCCTKDMKKQLHWSPKSPLPDVVKMLCQAKESESF